MDIQAEHVAEAFERPGIARAAINNGGDIALHLGAVLQVFDALDALGQLPRQLPRGAQALHGRGDDPSRRYVQRMQQAVRVSDHTAFFLAAENEPGHIVEQGLTTEIFGNPQDQRTLDYVNGRFG